MLIFQVVWITCFVIGTLAAIPNKQSRNNNESQSPTNTEVGSKRLLIEHSEQCTYISPDGTKIVAQPASEPATYGPQVASSALLALLHLDVNTKRPIWTKGVVDELDKIVASGGSISCEHYPHSAEDVALAVGHIDLDIANSKVGVVSSISPWVEHVLKSAGSSHVVTIDYNEPIVCTGIPWIESRSVAQFGAEVGLYDLLVSFSGIEHSGLGRYGDPINEVGDIEAMQQMHKALAPGGFLLLAIPTAHESKVAGIYHRIYGPDRLAWLLENRFAFVGRVWNGHVLGGWSDVLSHPKLFPKQNELDVPADWMNQHVLILQKLPDSINRTREMNISIIGDSSPESQLLRMALLAVTMAIAVHTIRRRMVGIGPF
ncbi:hypothetical protein HJC23_005093 [Cyclotella cryptica]|uniref:Methyltransferase type 11 domain-containing protein n=1 Tax=Cyclotella cryptica TaxID=29204 RepID=A0ABD3NVZ8_9STRA|eukprot:CCRYP_019584-RA/>CCRYP_019584-RA protein AED:0.18 eAED:0.18 QI:0/-1/0/1/-1/1/1/0/372